MSFLKDYSFEPLIDPDDPSDRVFLDAAKKMRHATVVSKSRSLREKRFGVEITYRGQKHEVHLFRVQVRCRPSDRGLAGFLKSKCLGLDECKHAK